MKPRDYPPGDYRRSELLLSHADFEHEAEVRGYVPKAALATARAELQEANGLLESERRANDKLEALNTALHEQLAAARVIAFEEAARWLEGLRFSSAIHPDEYPAAIRALASLPPSLVAVERETIEKVRRELRYAQDGLNKDEELYGELAAALALLEKVRP